MTPHITPASWIMVLILGIVWGGTFLLIDIALLGITPFWLAAARVGFAGALLTAVWQWRGGTLWLTDQRAWPMLVLASSLNSAIPFILLGWGIQHTASSFAGVSMATIPLMVLPLAHFFSPGEQLSRRRFFGFLIGFVGVVILIGGQAFDNTGDRLEQMGRLACLSAACCYAVNSIITRRLPPVDPIGLAALLMLVGAVLVIPTAWVVEGPPPLPDAQTLGVLAVLGLLPTAAANLLRVLIIRSAGSTFMAITNFIVPVVSVLLGALVLSENLPPQLLYALALILGGLGLSQFGALSRLFRR